MTLCDGRFGGSPASLVGDVAEQHPDAADIEMPAGMAVVRTTQEFDPESVPAGLLRAHRIASGVWGRLVVHSGSIGFGFDDQVPIADARVIVAGEHQVIPPGRPHHVTLVGDVRFVVEFHTDTVES